MTVNPFVNELQRRALLALMDAEAARVSATEREARHMKHKLYALIRERFGCKYTSLRSEQYNEAARLLLDEPLS